MAPPSHVVELADATLDLRQQFVDRGGVRVSLTTRETELLDYLVRHAGQPVARDELLREVWGYANPTRTRAVDDTMKRLRPKVEADPRQPVHLITVHGVGFRFEAVGPPTVPTTPSPPLLGRQDERARVHALFAAGARLVTLQGPGGVGKSTLAAAVATDTPGACRCDAADAAGPDDLARLVAQGLGAGGGPSPRSDLAGALRAMRAPLVVIDTYDRVVDDGLLAQWMSDAPAVRWLVTSRRRLGLPGEAVVELEGLDERAGLALFVRRARIEDPAFAPDEDEREVIAEVVRRLDGLPLAIELAAARVRVLRPAALLRRIHDRLHLLSGIDGGRHATLKQSIAWSWDPLDAAERTTLAQCTVFAGGFSLDAAEAVVRVDRPVMDVLQRLRDRSLVRGDCVDGELRFRLLESIRLFARARLADVAGALGRHARHYQAWTGGVARSLCGPHGVEAADRIEAEGNNILAAHGWLVEHDSHGAVALLCAVDRALYHRGDHARLAAAAERSLGAGELTHEDRAVALRVRGMNRFMLRRSARAVDDLVEAVSLGQAEGGEALVRAQMALATVRVDQRRFAEGRALLDRALSSGGADHQAGVLASRARAWLLEGRLDEALGAYTRALVAVRRTGDAREEALVLGNLGALHLDHGHLVEAVDRLSAALELHGERTGASASIVYFNLGLARLVTGAVGAAAAAWNEGGRRAREVGFRMGEGLSLLGLGVAASATGAEDAPRQLTAAARVFDEVGSASWSAYARTHRAAVACRRTRPGAGAGLRRALEALETATSPVREPTVALCEGWLALARGDLDHARAALPAPVDGRVDGGRTAPCMHGVVLRATLG